MRPVGPHRRIQAAGAPLWTMTRVAIPGPRDVRATLDEPTDGAGERDRCVVACPPHPQFGGSRSDRRLRAVSDALGARGVACLRFDYGPWDEGTGERGDAAAAIAWAGERYDAVGLFGYSFGGCVALVTAGDADTGASVAAVAALAPAPGLSDGSDAVAAVESLDRPVLVVCGDRDDTVDCESVATAAERVGHTVERLPADHHFVGQHERVGETVAAYLGPALR